MTATASGCVFKKADQKIGYLFIAEATTARNWVLAGIPKGHVEKHESARKCAAREAMEKAGVSGKVFKKPFGIYSYVKFDAKPVHFVSVFLLRVDAIEPDCHESLERKYTWVSPIEASTLVDEPELRGLFRALSSKSNKKAPPKQG